MANPTGKIKYRLTVNPRESVEQVSGSKSSTWTDVLIEATECFKGFSNHTTESITYQDTGGTDDGYLNGTKVYVQVTTSSTAAITGLSNVEFVYFKHTGFRYSSSTALSPTVNSADHLEIRGAAVDGFVIAILPPGAGIVLPVQSSSSWSTLADRVDSGDYFFQSVDPDDLTAGAQTIAMEFICVTHA